MLDLEAIKKACTEVIFGPGSYIELGACYALMFRFAGKEEADRFIFSVYKLADAAPQLVAEVERLRAENAALRNNLIAQEEMEVDRKARLDAALKKTNEKFGSVLERLAEQ